jgi:plasmid stability protein
MHMGQIVVRTLEDSVKVRWQRRARRNGRMEEEVRDILRNAAHEPEKPAKGLGTEIADLFKGKGYNFEVEEMRGHPCSRSSSKNSGVYDPSRHQRSLRADA